MEGLSAQQWLNSIGLILGMIGVGIIFFYGPPQPNLEEGVAIVVEDNTPLADGRTAAEHDRDVQQLRSRHSLLSKFGLALIFVGFAFQLTGTWIRQDGARFPQPVSNLPEEHNLQVEEEATTDFPETPGKQGADRAEQ